MTQHSAAFCRIERNLTHHATPHAIRWLTTRMQTFSSRIKGLSGLAMTQSFGWFGRTLGEDVDSFRMQWRALKGMSADRLAILGEEYCQDLLISNLEPVGMELLESARGRGERIILVSDNLDTIVQPLADHLGIKDIICNSMQFENQRATGILADPIFSGSMSGQWLRDYAEARSIDLDLSSGYGSNAGDSLMLSALGHPCAINPDIRLRTTARELNWPVVER